eukprot:gb/GEZN01000070.1/.p1 GENE.gb/GEZN01000070.1/~~gb/GEZN01000070.1/.p1  ORF type:complete len:2436 (+),score=418.65 gb/GEZN01000070.1/:121-7308(+)
MSSTVSSVATMVPCSKSSASLTASSSSSASPASLLLSSSESGSTPMDLDVGKVTVEKDHNFSGQLVNKESTISTSSSSSSSGVVSFSFSSSDQAQAEFEVVDSEIVNSIIQRLLGGEAAKSYSEELRIHLLRLATLLIEHLAKELVHLENQSVHYRKDLIRFAWNHLKSDNTASKQWAYVNVCKFIDVYETPPKIVLQVYVALLRAYQPESKSLVCKALDSLMPALPKRLPPGEHKYPTWIKWTKKIIVEEGHLVPQLIHIWNLIIRHPDLFYSSRTQFVPQMVNSLNRLGLPANRPLENRKLAVGLAHLIICWDRRCIRDLELKIARQQQQRQAASSHGSPAALRAGASPAKPDASKSASTESSNPAPAPAATTDPLAVAVSSTMATPSTPSTPSDRPRAAREQEFRPNTVMIELILTFLIRLGLMTCVGNPRQSHTDQAETLGLSQRCLQLLTQAMQIWQGGEVKFAYIEKILASPNPGNVNALLSTTLKVLNILLTHQPPTFTARNIVSIHKILLQCYSSLEAEIRTSIYELLGKILAQFPFQPERAPRLGHPGPKTPALKHPAQIFQFQGYLKEQILSGIKEADKNKIHTVLGMAAVVCQNYPAFLDTNLSALLKVVQKLAKEHLQKQQQRRDLGAAAAVVTPDERAKNTLLSQSLVKGMVILRDRVAHIGENKKTYLGMLLLLIDRSSDEDVLFHIVEAVGSWILSPRVTAGAKGPYPQLSHKDKINFLLRMARFEVVGSHMPRLLHKYLDVVYQMFAYTLGSDPSSPRPEWLNRLQRPFMIGLRCKSTKIRAKFTKMFHSHVTRTLVDRMGYLINLQDWEPLQDSFWLAQGVDLLVTVFQGEDILKSPSGPRLSALHRAGKSKHAENDETQMVSDAVQLAFTKMDSQDSGAGSEEATKDLVAKTTALLQEQGKWLQLQHASRHVNSLLEPWRQLTLESEDVAALGFEHVFPLAWSKLSDKQRAKFVRPLSSLLAKWWHDSPTTRKFPMNGQFNAIQALLQGLSKCSPLPVIQPQLLLHLARRSNAWYTCASMLERRMLTSSANKAELDSNPFTALSLLYRDLQENDIRHGLRLTRLRSQHSRAALAFERFGAWDKAQDMFFEAQKTLALGAHVPGVREVGVEEATLWDEEWVECAKQLNQWKILGELAKEEMHGGVGHPELQLQASWRGGDWALLKDLSSKEKSRSTPSDRLHHIYAAIQDRNKNFQDREVEKLCDQAYQTALRQWQGRPALVGTAHLELLQRFQRLVELSESARMMRDLQVYAKQRMTPNFKSFITTWRERLPNEWEDLLVWSSVLTWRIHVFTLITVSLPDANVQQFPAIVDKPWAMIKFAQTARKHGLPAVCMHTLHTMTQSTPALEPSDAFAKVREQIKTCLESQIQTEIRLGYNLVNVANLDFFNTEQKAEMFRLKAEALQQLGFGDESNTAFSACLSICDTHGRGWLSWGMFCDQVFVLKKELQWAEHAVVCYLQAVSNKCKKASFFIARILWLLSFEVKAGMVNRAFANFADSVPSWIWLLWTPQLLTSLARPEGPIVKLILCKIARIYPQSLYYTVRAHLIEQREVRQSSPSSSHSSSISAVRSTPSPAPGSSSCSSDVTGVASAQESPNNVIQPVAGESAPQQSSSSTSTATTAVASNAVATAKQVPSAPATGSSLPDSAGTSNQGATALQAQLAQAQLRQAQASKAYLQVGAATGASVEAHFGAVPGLQQGTQPTPQQQQYYIQQQAAAAGAAAGAAFAQQPVVTSGQAATAADQLATSSTAATAASGTSAGTVQLAGQQQGATAPLAGQQQGATAPGSGGLAAPPANVPTATSSLGSTVPAGTASSAPAATAPTAASGGGPAKRALETHFVEDVVNVLRRSHPSLMTEVERMLDEFSRRFKPEPEEELLGAVHALILKCFKQPVYSSDAIPSVLRSTIHRVCQKFFTPDPSANNKKHLAFVEKYKACFERDFMPAPQGTQFPNSVSELLARLKKWKYHLQYRVVRKDQTQLRLERLSPYLIRFQCFHIQIPGQYLGETEPNVDQNVILEQFEPLVTVHHTHGYSHRRIGMRGSDGNSYYFLVQYSISHITRCDERMMQFYVLLNRLMDQYSDTRKRNLQFSVPLVVPLTHRLRLMETPPSHVSLEEVFEESCAVRNVDSDMPLLKHREMIRKLSVDGMPAAKLSLHVLKDICNTLVPDTILRDYVQRMLPRLDEYWGFKKEFAAQMALSGFLSYMMRIGDRTLHKIAFLKESGRVVNSELYPSYSERCLIDVKEHVPLRLTRNLTTFMTQFVVEGLVANSMMAATRCLEQNKDVLKNYLCLFIRDDLLSWNSTKMPLSSSQAQRHMEDRLRPAIAQNVKAIRERIHVLTPSRSHNSPIEITHHVRALMQTAMTPKHLARMNPTWAPWF